MKKKVYPVWKIKLIKPGRLLDIGCQYGKLRNYVKEYDGLDYDDNFEKAWTQKGGKLIKADIRNKLPIKNESYDVVWASHVLEHILTQEQYNFVGECFRILKPGGYLIMFAPTPYHWYFWDHPTHQRPVTHGGLMSLCKKNKFKIEQAKYSKMRWFPTSWQRFLRLPPLRWFLWDVYIVAQKPEKEHGSK